MSTLSLIFFCRRTSFGPISMLSTSILYSGSFGNICAASPEVKQLVSIGWFGPTSPTEQLVWESRRFRDQASTYLKTWKVASPAQRLLEIFASAKQVSTTFGLDAKHTVQASTRPIDLHPYDPNEHGQEDAFLFKGKPYVQREARGLWPEFLGSCWLSQFFDIHALAFCDCRLLVLSASVADMHMRFGGLFGMSLHLHDSK